MIGTFNSGCAAIEIPVLNQAPGGGVLMVSPANTYGCLTEPCAGNEPEKYYPTRHAQLHARRAERPEPGCGRGPADEGAGRQERLHPQRQGGLRARRRQERPGRGRGGRDQGRRLRGLRAEVGELRGPVHEDQGHEPRRGLHRRPDRRERRPADQRQGRRARAEQRRREAVPAGRLRDRRRSSSPPRAGRRRPRTRSSRSPVPRSTSSRARAASSRRSSRARCSKGKPVDPYAILAVQAADVVLQAIANSDGTRASITRRGLQDQGRRRLHRRVRVQRERRRHRRERRRADVQRLQGHGQAGHAEDGEA